MIYARNLTTKLTAWWLGLEKKYLPEYVWESDLLAFWRERVLFCIGYIITVFCPFVLIPSLLLCVKLEMWGTFALDLMSYLLVVGILCSRKLPLLYRAGTMCFIGYCLGVGLLFSLGPVGAGYIWMFGASVLGGAMMGLRTGTIILVANFFAFVALTLYILTGSPEWITDSDGFIVRWLVITINFILLNVIITMTTALMLRGLKTALLQEKKFSTSLQESEERYRMLAENANDVIWTTDTSLKITYISPSVETLRGYTPEEAMKLNVEETLTPDSLILVTEKFTEKLSHAGMDEASNEPVVMDAEFNCKDGSTIWMENSASFIKNNDGTIIGVLGISRDITDRRRVASECLKSEGIFKAVKNVSFVIIEPEPENPLILEFSPGAESIFGYDRKALTGAPVSILKLPDEMLDFTRLYNQREEGKIGFSGEVMLERKSGEKFPGLFSTYPLLDDGGRVHAVLSVSIDISEQKKFEKQLIRSEKMAALGGLVAGMVHEISTPLGVALTSASFLQSKTETFGKQYSADQMDEADFDRYVYNAVEASKMVLLNISRAVDLVNSFKQVAVDQTGEIVRSFNLKNYLEDIVLSLTPQIKKSGHTIIMTCPDNIMLDSYPGAFYQVLSNLVMNSVIHGFNDGLNGLISVEVDADDETILIEYNDNGSGINPEHSGKIFDPFFTTRRNQGGTGLGLHIVYNIVTQRLGGEIICEDDHDKGAHFTIKIPLEKKKDSE